MRGRRRRGEWRGQRGPGRRRRRGPAGPARCRPVLRGSRRAEPRAGRHQARPPIFLTAPAGDDRLFIIEQQAGLIRIVDAGGELLATPYLDLSDTIGNNGSYTGVLGLAFHPDYASNGRFFVTYTDSLGGSGAMDLALAEYGVSDGDPDVANPDPVGEPILFAVATANGHYGGQLAFGPDDKLYAGFGDMDGEGGNMSGSAQDLGNLAGKILRIDTGDAVGEATVPDDNPFVNQGGARGEVFAYGLRVPWRWAFDSMTGDFFVADVSQTGSRRSTCGPPASSPGQASAGPSSRARCAWTTRATPRACSRPTPTTTAARRGRSSAAPCTAAARSVPRRALLLRRPRDRRRAVLRAQRQRPGGRPRRRTRRCEARSSPRSEWTDTARCTSSSSRATSSASSPPNALVSSAKPDYRG